MPSQPHSIDSTPERLLQAAMEIAAARGASAIASRWLAEQAGVSPSAVNYAFGSLEGLVAEARRRGDSERAAYWAGTGRTLAGLDASPPDFGPALFSALRGAAATAPGPEALFWGDVIEAARVGRPVTDIEAVAAERACWDGLLAACGLAPSLGGLVQAFALGVRLAYRVFERPEAFDPWALALVLRFAERLTGGPCDAPLDSALRARAEARANRQEGVPVADHETARLIVRTTVDIVLAQGAEAATHRAISQRAGLSVSSVQHFFGGRRDYLLAAFQAIYQSARERAVPVMLAPGSLTAENLVAGLQSAPNGASEETRREFAAMNGLLLSAAADEATRPIAEGLVARTGQTSVHLLNALAARRGRIGRLDGQIVSMTLSHVATLDLCRPDPDAPGLFPEIAPLLLKALFVEGDAAQRDPS